MQNQATQGVFNQQLRSAQRLTDTRELYVHTFRPKSGMFVNRDKFSKYIDKKEEINFCVYPHRVQLNSHGSKVVQLLSEDGESFRLEIISFNLRPQKLSVQAADSVLEAKYNKSMFHYLFEH